MTDEIDFSRLVYYAIATIIDDVGGVVHIDYTKYLRMIEDIDSGKKQLMITTNYHQTAKANIIIMEVMDESKN